jgi:sugar O-acyltransferase (sialic acid O-acetyltransferase NeuD family)
METMKEIYLLGVGRNTPVFIELAEQCDYKILGLYHFNTERTGETDHGLLIEGSFNDLFTRQSLKDLNFLLTMGDIKIRAYLSEKIRAKGGNLPSLIHPTALISRFSIIEDGVCIGAFSNIQADTHIYQDTVILSGVNIAHNNTIGKCCFIASGATIGSYTLVEDFVFIGQRALSVSLKVGKIGSNSVIGAGSLVTKSVSQFDIVAGSPAKSIKKNNKC